VAVAWAVVIGSLYRSWLTYRYLRTLADIGAAALFESCAKSLLVTLACALVPALLLVTRERGGNVGLLPMICAALAVLGVWMGMVVLVGHPLAGELGFLRGKLTARVRAG
jgi:hypothetical protein